MQQRKNPDIPLSVRIASESASLKPTERKVIEAIMADQVAAVELTAQQLADQVGVSRASVIRTAQMLGYTGFPQLRVALAQEAASQRENNNQPHDTMLATLQSRVSEFSHRLHASFSAVDENALQAAVEKLDTAQRVLVIANGYSGPVGLDLAQRLISAHRSAEFHMDEMTQRIAAHTLDESSLCIVCSGSGINKTSLDVVKEAKNAGATVLALTHFAQSPLTEESHLALVVPPTNTSFRDELIHTSRAALMVLVEQLVELLIEFRGSKGAANRAAVLSMLGDVLQE